jgi:hypothetical protein
VVSLTVEEDFVLISADMGEGSGNAGRHSSGNRLHIFATGESGNVPPADSGMRASKCSQHRHRIRLASCVRFSVRSPK